MWPQKIDSIRRRLIGISNGSLGLHFLLAVIYFNQFLDNHSSDTGIPFNNDSLESNNLINFPLHDFLVSNQEVGKYVDKIMQLPECKYLDQNSPIPDLKPSDDACQKLAEILLDKDIL